MLTFVNCAILKDELIDELKSLRLSNELHLTEQWVVSKVELGGSADPLHRLPILHTAVSVVSVVATKLLLKAQDAKTSQSKVTNTEMRSGYGYHRHQRSHRPR